MYENTIDEILTTDKISNNYYLGSFAFDELPEITKFPSCLIINTEPRTQSGEHWLACYFDKKKIAFFFDSYGHKPSMYKLDSYLRKNSFKIYYNKRKIQGILPYCGFYSVLFLLFICRGKLDAFYYPFGKNVILNDHFIFKNINKNKR